jgi:hypothetical protein
MDFSTTSIQNISVHHVGNIAMEEPLILSDKEIDLNPKIGQILKDSFLNRFMFLGNSYHFSHSNSLQFHEIYNYVKDLLESKESFHETTIHIAKHLYENSVHPKTKSGELYVCKFKNFEFEGSYTDAIGIFKTESKTTFFDVKTQIQSFELSCQEGIDMSKFEKGCLILNKEKEAGFQVYIVDNQNNRGEEALYWREHFLGLSMRNTNFSQTNLLLNMTKEYITKQIPNDFTVDKTEQIDLLNRSVDFFKNNDTFDKATFEEEVFQDKTLIQSFHNFNEAYLAKSEITFPEAFDISPEAVKKQVKAFKSVLKLDKNFHIYIHGNKDLIEKGVDENGKKFYKIYYDKED